MQAYHRRKIMGFGLIGLVAMVLACAHSRPQFTYESSEIHNSPGAGLRAPAVEVEVPATSRRDRDQKADRRKDY